VPAAIIGGHARLALRHHIRRGQRGLEARQPHGGADRGCLRRGGDARLGRVPAVRFGDAVAVGGLRNVTAVDMADRQMAETDVAVWPAAQHGCPVSALPVEGDPSRVVGMALAGLGQLDLRLGLVAQRENEDRSNRKRKARCHYRCLPVRDEEPPVRSPFSDRPAPDKIGASAINLLRLANVAVEVIRLTL